jgi:hypothetical protein
MKAKFLLIILGFMQIQNAHADKEVRYTKKKDYQFGQISCKQFEKVKSEESNRRGEVYFECYVRQKRILKIDKYSESVFASNNSKYFVGISNIGVYPSAFWVIDNSGHLIAEENHDTKQIKKSLSYCEQTISIKREWADLKDPNISFDFKDNKLVDITLNGCDGKRIKLSDFATFK